MINIPKNRIYNAYIIETYNYERTKKAIKEFAIINGFEKAYVDTDNHPDIFYLESEENIKIETIRKEIVESAIYAPKIANYKIYVIYDAVNMEVIAQDTILKTLEEPPTFDIFFLVTSNANKFLDTIKSRCFIIKDDENIDYKRLLELEFMNEAVLTLANAKYDNLNIRMQFAEKFLDKENKLKDLISLYRYVLRDALLYKLTYNKKNLYLKEIETEIIAISSSYEIFELGKLIDNLNILMNANNNFVNKKIAVFNFFEV